MILTSKLLRFGSTSDIKQTRNFTAGPQLSARYIQLLPATISFYSLDALEPNAAFVSWPSSHVEDYTQTGLSQSRTHDQVIQVLELVLNQRHRHGIELPKISLLNCLKCAFVVNIMQYLTSGPFSKIPLTIHRERMLYATAQRDKSYDINVSRIRRAPMS